MAAWPPINARSTPIVNTTGIPAMNANTEDTPASSPSAPAIGSSNGEVTFDPQKQSNPYFLHINENPALELVSFPLDGSNYHPWARAMTMALSCKNKIAFVNGAITKPSEDDMERFLAWERCNNMVMSWIVRTLSPTIGRSVLWIDTVYGIWNNLRRSVPIEVSETPQSHSQVSDNINSEHAYLYQGEIPEQSPTPPEMDLPKHCLLLCFNGLYLNWAFIIYMRQFTAGVGGGGY
nr:uncharacterized protein LOC109161680 [Ipomoea batatas]